MAGDKRYIQSHCGLRGIAASLVVAYHLQFGAATLLPFESATAFFRRGYLWVDLFFILSGFIISLTTQPAGRWLSRAEVVAFLRHRFARIYPLHAFCLFYFTVFLGIAAIYESTTTGAIPARWSGEGMLSLLVELLLLHAWGIGHSIPWNIPSWSISAEIFAYICYPFMLILGLYRIGWAVMLAAAIGFFGWIAASTGSLDIISGLAPFRCLAGFAVGMLLFHWRGCWAALPDWLLTLIQLLAVAAIVTLLALPFNDSFIIAPFALLVGTSWEDRGWVARALSARPFRFLGDISYSIYLNHVCLIQIIFFFWSRLVEKTGIMPADMSRILWIMLVFGVTLLASTVTYRYVERPMRRYLIRGRGERASALPAAVG